MSDKKIVIYTTQTCPYCNAAKDLLDKKGYAYESIDVTSDTEQREKLVEMTGGRTTVPQIFIDDKSIGGFQELNALFEEKGEL